MNNIFSLCSIVASIICWVLGAIVFLNNKYDLRNKSFSLLLVSIGIWTLFPFLSSIAVDDAVAIFHARLVYIFAIFTPPNFYLAISALLGTAKMKKNKIAISIMYCISCLFFFISFSRLFIRGVYRFQPNFFVNPGSFFSLFIIFFGTICLFTFHELFTAFRKSSGSFRNQIIYILTGFIIAFIGGVLHVFAPYLNMEIVPHDIFIIIFALIITYTIIRYRLMDINIVIRKMITVGLLAIFITTGIVGIVMMHIGTILKLFTSFVFGILITVYLPKFKIKMENAVTSILYKEKYKYQDVLERFIGKMVLIPQEEDLLRSTAGVLSEVLGIKKAGIFILDPTFGNYSIRFQIGLDGVKDYKIDAEKGLVQWLKEHRDIFVKEEAEKSSSKEDYEFVLRIIGPLGATVCVPVLLSDDLLGIITLGEKSSGEMYTHIDLEILEKLGTQLAVALDYKRIEAQLRSEQQLASIGIMAMEISHEMRNLLQSPQTFIDLVPDRANDSDFMTNFRGMALDRLRVVSSKLYDIMYFGKERPLNLSSGVDINKLLDINIAANDFNIKKENIKIKKEYGAIPTVKADKDQLTHLFNNLILNAVEAMKGKTGLIRIRTMKGNGVTGEMNEKSQEWIRIEIKDDGAGIPEPVLKKLFTPFFTTKSMGTIQKSGTGLGLAVVRKVVNAHKGYININSKEGKGTTVVVDLPVDLKLSSNVPYFT